MRKPYVISIAILLAGAVGACKETRKPDARQAEAETPATGQERPTETSPRAVRQTPDSPLEASVMQQVSQLTWGEGPPSLPAGVQMAVLEGTPPFEQEKTFTIIVRAPRNYKVPPHVHLVTERVTVLKGTGYLGHGTKLDTEKATAVESGGFATLPAGHEHYFFTANEEAIVQLQGVGPWGIAYVNPEDDPRQPPPPKPEHESQWDSKVQAAFTNVEDVRWKDAPAGLLPKGAQVAMLEGDPTVEDKTFILRVKMPDGYRLPVHSHAMTDRFVVLSGALMVGTGETWDEAGLREMAAPSVLILKAGENHYARANGETVIQVFGVGPYEFAWASPDDDPARAEAGTATGERAARERSQ